jgi:hypothetical protein
VLLWLEQTKLYDQFQSELFDLLSKEEKVLGGSFVYDLKFHARLKHSSEMMKNIGRILLNFHI